MTATAALLSTHVPGLDPVLGGGITPGSLALIIGPPGAGKTILASQIAFGAARQGRRVLILTAYSEGHVKYLNHLRSFSFFDEQLVGDKVTLLSMQTLLPSGSESAAAALLRAIREARAQIVLLDGFQGLDVILPGTMAVRAFLAALSAQMSFVPATLLMTIAGSARDEQLSVELTAADVVIDLGYRLVERRHVRQMDVVKQRGHAPLPGAHTYVIESDGVRVFPRIEVHPLPGPQSALSGRAAFGLPELDDMLRGGLNVGTATVLAGAPSTGKTTLALHWALADPEERTLFITLSEYPDQLIYKAAAFGLPLEEAVRDQRVRLLWFSPVELDPERMANDLLEAQAETGATRLVVDTTTFLLRELGERASPFFLALRALLHSRGVTSLFLLTIEPFVGFRLNMANTPMGILAENLIVVQQVETEGAIQGVLAVLRMRFSDYDRSLRELYLSDSGVQVRKRDEHSERDC
jgi:circadian clock protein KaiC